MRQTDDIKMLVIQAKHRTKTYITPVWQKWRLSASHQLLWLK